MEPRASHAKTPARTALSVDRHDHSNQSSPSEAKQSEAKSEKDEIEEHYRRAIAILHTSTLHTRTHHDQYNRKLVLPTVRSRTYDAPPIT